MMSQRKIPVKLRIMAKHYATSIRGKPTKKASDQSYDRGLGRWPSGPNCTPYEILEQPRDAPYRKQRFCELIKVYHPDRWQYTVDHGISKATRAERYLLIVTANMILSDPARRKAYDDLGLGWETNSSRAQTGMSQRQPANMEYSNTFQSRGHRQAGASMNATWEDWERWRNSTNSQQQTIFMCNERFALILLLFMVIGACSQLARAEHAAKLDFRARDQLHEFLIGELQELQLNARGLGRQDLIEAFLGRRSLRKCDLT